MKEKGLTLTVIFEASSLNYGESLGNITQLKKITREKGDEFTYLSRQALRYNITRQMNIDNTNLSLDGSVIQYDYNTNIKDFAEIDLFGYMKTKSKKDEKGDKTKTRNAVVRLTNAISLETFKMNTDFLTNLSLLNRYNNSNEDKKDGGNISQSEIHFSFYRYTIAVDLEKVGIDQNDNINIDNKEKTRRINLLIDTIMNLFRDIRGRRENLSPIFIIGGIYDSKNIFFSNVVNVKNNKITVKSIESILTDDIKKDTNCFFIEDIFDNDEEIRNKLKTLNKNDFINDLKKKVEDYYENENY